MGHPSSLYIKYLLVKAIADGQIADHKTRKLAREVAKVHPTPEDKAFQEFYHYDVDETLLVYALPRIEESELYAIERRLHVPKYVQFWNYRHVPTQDFMKREGLYQIWRPDPGEQSVFSLLGMNLVQDTVRILLMGHVPFVTVASKVAQKFGVNIPVAALETYYNYFWNVNSVSMGEWPLYVRGSYLRDHLISSLAGPGQALYRAGFDPKIDGNVSLKDLQRTLHYRLEATRLMPDIPETAAIIARLSKELVAVHNVLYGEGAGLEDTLRKFREFRMELKKSEAVPIRELAPDGNFSGSGIVEGKDGKRLLGTGSGVGSDNRGS